MTRTHIAIAGKQFALARQSLLPSGARQWHVRPRPWQHGDPRIPKIAEWNISGANFYSTEDISQSEEGYLGVDYSDYGCDTRWQNRVSLTPLMNTVTLSTYDATFTESPLSSATSIADTNWFLDGSPVAGNVDDIVTVDFSGTTYAYLMCGRFVRKVDLATMTLQNDTHVLPADGTRMFKTYTAAGNVELTVCMESQPYEVMNLVQLAPDRDNWVTNSQGFVARVGGESTQAVRLLNGNKIYGNVISGSVTMANPNVELVTTIKGQKLTPTGFALDGSLEVLGYDDGPYLYDSNENQYFPEMPELDRHLENCKAMGTWFPLGVLIGLRSGARFQRGGYGASFGPEIIDGNRSPVLGFPTAFSGSERWLYMAYYCTDGHTRIIAYDPKQTDQRTASGMPPYVISTLDSIRVNAIQYIGTVNGLRSRGTVILGHGSNFLWFTVGNTREELDDSSFRFELDGTWYGTRLRRNRGSTIDLEWIQITASGATAARTITLGVTVTTTTGTTNTVSLAGTVTGVNDVVASNGRARRLFVDNSSVPLTTVAGIDFRPFFSLLSDASTASPVAEGKIQVGYHERPIVTRLLEFSVVLDTKSPDGRGPRIQTNDLFTDLVGGTILVQDDWDGQSMYIHVEDVDILEVKDTGGDKSQPDKTVRVANVKAAIVPTTTGN